MSRLENNSVHIEGLIQDINIFLIRPHSICRFTTSDDDLSDISNSIKQKGLLNPIIVRTQGEYFEIVAGNRRYHACKSLGWRKITCHVVELNDRESFELSLTENIQRKTLQPIEEAHAFKKYISDLGWGGLTDLAKQIGKSVSYVTKRIKLLDLPPEVFNFIVKSNISVSIAEELYSVKDSLKQRELAEIISTRHLSFRKARKLVQGIYQYDNTEKVDEVAEQNSTGRNDDERVKRSFDKSVIALRIAMIRVGEITASIQDNWIAKEIFMQHKNMLHMQIDLLIKEKMKLCQANM
jgi:ParB family chromosome partitioning protein